MSELGQVVTFAAKLYGEHASVRYAGYLRRDPMARLELRPERDRDPRPVTPAGDNAKRPKISRIITAGAQAPS